MKALQIREVRELLTVTTDWVAPSGIDPALTITLVGSGGGGGGGGGTGPSGTSHGSCGGAGGGAGEFLVVGLVVETGDVIRCEIQPGGSGGEGGRQAHPASKGIDGDQTRVTHLRNGVALAQPFTVRGGFGGDPGAFNSNGQPSTASWGWTGGRGGNGMNLGGSSWGEDAPLGGKRYGRGGNGGEGGHQNANDQGGGGGGGGSPSLLGFGGNGLGGMVYNAQTETDFINSSGERKAGDGSYGSGGGGGGGANNSATDNYRGGQGGDGGSGVAQFIYNLSSP